MRSLEIILADNCLYIVRELRRQGRRVIGVGYITTRFQLHMNASILQHDQLTNSESELSATIKMDMPGMTMTSSATSTASAAMASMTGMSGMDMGGGSCKISVRSLPNVGLSSTSS